LSVALEDDPSPPTLDRSLSPRFRSGSTLGPFRIIGLLGQGGMAEVYEAYDSSLDRSVALKVLPSEFLHDDSFARRFRQEGRFVARLEHPNIVPIYASGIDDAIAWMSMRLLSGGTLGALMQRERLSPERSVQILRAVANALDYAHARGVIHRDIKPTNILLDQAEHVCVADFGLAFMMEFNPRQTTTRTIVGTPQYMAPEVGLGKTLDHRSDIYSLGVVAYEMLSGEPPFTADSPMALLLKHVNDTPPSPPGVAAPLRRVLRKALAKDPGERWSSAGAFVEALEDGISTTPSRSVAVARRRSALAAIGVTVAVVILLIVRELPDSPSPPSVAQLSSPAAAPASAVVPSEPTAPPVVERPENARERPRANSARALSRAVVADGRESTTPQAEDPQQTIAPPPDVTSAATAAPEERSPPPIAESAAVPTVQRVVPPDVIEQPVRLRTVVAEYPSAARAAQIAGNVLLRATIGLDGAVTDVAVVESVHPLLDQAARKAVLQYVYRPALRNAVPEVATVVITVSFRLE
jgi:TonB family protein